MASKLITSFPGNLSEGSALPAVQAVCVLFDGPDGRPLAVIDGTEITYWRTAADSALGARLLAGAAPETLLVVGAGAMAMRLVQAHRAVRPSIRRVLIWNRTRERAERLAASIAEDGIDAEVRDDLAAATRDADVVTTCTRSRTPLVHGANLRPAATSTSSAATRPTRGKPTTRRCSARASSSIVASRPSPASATSSSR